MENYSTRGDLFKKSGNENYSTKGDLLKKCRNKFLEKIHSGGN